MAGRNLQGGKRMEEQEKNQGGQEGAILVDMPLLQHTLSRMKKEKENFQELLQQGQEGEESVFYDIAVCYIEGKGTKKDPAQAV